MGREKPGPAWRNQSIWRLPRTGTQVEGMRQRQYRDKTQVWVLELVQDPVQFDGDRVPHILTARVRIVLQAVVGLD